MGTTQDVWEEEYEELLESSKASGEIELVSSSPDKREYPRFRLKAGAVWIRTDTAFDVIDVSVSGISFYSDQEFQLKQHLAITLGKAFKIEAEIIHCKPVEADPDTGASRYLVRCRFTDEHSSKRFLLMLKGMEDQDISISS